jgi:hypothetical protein
MSRAHTERARAAAREINKDFSVNLNPREAIAISTKADGRRKSNQRDKHSRFR